MTRIFKSIGRSEFRKNNQWWQKLSTSLKVLNFPPYIKSARSVEYRCLECRSDQLSVLFRRRNYKAETIYLLKRKKDFLTPLYHPLELGYVPPARINLYPKNARSTYLSLSSAGSRICYASQNQYLSEGRSRSIYPSIIRWGKDMSRQPESISIRRSRSTYLSLSSTGARICSASKNQYLPKELRFTYLSLSSARARICSASQSQYLSKGRSRSTYLFLSQLGQGYVLPARINIYQKVEVYIPLSIICWGKDMFCQQEYFFYQKVEVYIPLSIIRWD